MSNNKSELMEELKGILIEYVKVMEETYSEEIYDKYMESFIELAVYMREVYYENDYISDVMECSDRVIEEEYLLLKQKYDKLEHQFFFLDKY